MIFLTFSATAALTRSPIAVRASGDGVWISTDKQDYSPEQTVIISGGGFSPSAQILVTVERPDGRVDAIYTVADDAGNFSCTYQLDGITGTYSVEASDGESTATVTFTDTSVDIYATTGGTVSYAYTDSSGNPQSGTVSAGGSIHVGAKKDTTFYLTANPSSDCTFTGWTGGYTGTTNPYSWTVGTGSVSITAHFTTPPPTQHTVSFAQSGCGAGYNPTVEYWIDSGSHTTNTVPFSVQVDDGHQISYTYQLIVPGAAGVQYVRTGVSLASPQTVTGDLTVTGSYNTQFKVHFEWSGLGTDADAKTVVTITVDGTPTVKTGVDPFYDEWLDSGTTVSYVYEDPIVITADVKRYRLDSVTGTSTDQSHDFGAISGAITEAALYQAQFYITFAQTGVGIDFTGTVVTIDTVDYDRSGASFWWDENTDHSFAFQSPLVVTADVKRYVWDTTSGLSTSQSDALFHVTGSGTVTGNYKTQWEQTFASSGLGADATGTLVVVTVTGGAPSGVNPIGVPSGTLWIEEGAIVAYAFSNPVLPFPLDNKQYWLHDVTGPLSGYTVAGANTITGNYLALPLSQISTIDGVHFRLIFTNDPLDLSKYKLTASNPGQFHYTIFCTGTPGAATTITITIPYPFVTQGAVPIHLYSYVDIVSGHFVLSGELGGFSVSPLTFPTPGPLTGTLVTITGTVPSSGLVVVTIHLDYGLKTVSGYSQGLSGKAVHYLDPNKSIFDNTPYVFSFHDGVSGSLEIRNINIFKHDPGFAGIVTDASGTPVAGVKVEIRGPTGALLATVYTDEDGFYFFYYKYTGKAATFTVKLPSYGKSQSVTVKPNTVVQVNFTLP